jgi:hypothetical protein
MAMNLRLDRAVEYAARLQKSMKVEYNNSESLGSDPTDAIEKARLVCFYTLLDSIPSITTIYSGFLS